MECRCAVAANRVERGVLGGGSGSSIGGAMPDVLVAGGHGFYTRSAMIHRQVQRHRAVAASRIERCEL